MTKAGYTLTDGVIRYKEAHQAVMLALHASGLGGHSGMTATYQKVKSLFFWPNMKADIQHYVSNCQVCS